MKSLPGVIYSVLSIVFMGCYTPHFLPNTAPTPMFDHAGDVRLTGYAGTNSYDVHVAISPVDHIGLVGAGSWSFGKKIEPADKTTPENEIEWSHSHRYFEGAVAFYLSPFSLRKDMMKFRRYGLLRTAHCSIQFLWMRQSAL